MCFAPQRRAHSTSERPKAVRTCGVLTILTWRCASRHNEVYFFDISTSKSGPTFVCFVHFGLKIFFAPQWSALFRHLNFQKWSEHLVFYHFDLEMCFAPQRGVLFRHLNFQEWSDVCVFCTFWLENILRATMECTFSTSQLPKVVRTFGVLPFWLGDVLRAAPACTFSRCQPQECSEREAFLPFLLLNVFRATTACNFSSLIWPAGSAPAALASLLFDPPEPQIIGKTRWIATFLPFRAPASSFFSLSLSLSLSPLTLPTSAFPSVHIVGSLTSKLPSIRTCIIISSRNVLSTFLKVSTLHVWESPKIV